MKVAEERLFKQDTIDRVYKKLAESGRDMNQLLSDLMTIAFSKEVHGE